MSMGKDGRSSRESLNFCSSMVAINEATLALKKKIYSRLGQIGSYFLFTAYTQKHSNPFHRNEKPETLNIY